MGVISRLIRYGISILKLFALIGILTLVVIGPTFDSEHAQESPIQFDNIFQQKGEDPSGDLDNDGLTNYNETYLYQTNKTNPDTDNDGLTDYEEIHTNRTRATNPHSITPIYTDGELHEYGINLQTGLQQPASNQSHSLPYIHYTDLHTPLQTQPGTHDTDGDGLTDTYEHSKNTFSPTQKDVLINVYTTQNTTIQLRTLIESEYIFSTLPTTTTNTSGIQLHFVIHDTPALKNPHATTTTTEQYIQNIHPQLYTPTTQQKTPSAHYRPYTLIYTSNISHRPSIGYASKSQNLAVIETQDPSAADTTVHELGHLFGLQSTKFHGIDTHNVPYNKYPSIMNYNYNKHNDVQTQKFSSQPPFNDIHTIETTLEQQHNVSVYAGLDQ